MQALGHDFSDLHRLQLLQSYRPPEAISAQGNTHVQNGILRDYFLDRGFMSKVEEYGDLMRRVREKSHFPPYPDVSKVVPAVQAVGAVVAIAHPLGYFRKHDVQRMDALREECRLDGIECAHPSIPAEYTTRYRAYCLQHGLFSVAGTDCHFKGSVRNSFARHGGKEEWLDEFLTRLDCA
ncbi:MAG: hypothetical protein KAI66_00035, partial [Lentisphaeria bacterium]|nr:hypothetical protein [Lentisphaeria bacterium]